MILTSTQPLNPSALPGIYVITEGEVSNLACPLEHTEVAAKLDLNIARVRVTQVFSNPFAHPIEAEYRFPLPEDSAVDSLHLTIGEEVIIGQIREKVKARQEYEQAKAEGKTAALLEQQRDNLFTQQLANILPGEQISVQIEYTDVLKFEGASYTFRFPMVVGPRYTGGDVQKGKEDPNTVYLPPETRNGHNIQLSILLQTGVPIQNLHSPSHAIQTRPLDPGNTPEQIEITLSPEDRIPNKDFVLMFAVSSAQEQATVLSHVDEEAKTLHFAAFILPALRYTPETLVGRDILLIIDTSGSQQGQGMVQTKNVANTILNSLTERDSFSIVDFANTSQAFRADPVTATEQNKTLAKQYINSLQANGGTELLRGMNFALQYPPSQAHRLRDIVMITDGLVSNESQILAALKQGIPAGTHLHTFATGSAPNTFLLERLAGLGGGQYIPMGYTDTGLEVAQKFISQVGRPVLTKVKTSLTSMPGVELYPEVIPDLYEGHPVVVYGKYSLQTLPSAAVEVTISGESADGAFTQTVPVPIQGTNMAIAQLFARQKIKHLELSHIERQQQIVVKKVTELALDYHLVSTYTSLIAVSSRIRTTVEEEKALQILTPSHSPAGMDMMRRSRYSYARDSVASGPDFSAASEYPVPPLCMYRIDDEWSRAEEAQQVCDIKAKQAQEMIDNKQYRSAIKFLTIAINKSPTEAGFFALRGIAQLRQGDITMAENDLQFALKIDPDCEEAKRGLNDEEFKLGLDNRLQQLITKAREIIANKRYRKAIRFLTKAIDKLPREATLFALRGIAQLRKGEVTKAKEDLEHALQIDPGNVDAKEALEELALIQENLNVSTPLSWLFKLAKR